MRAVIVRYHVFAALVNLRLFAPILLLLYTDRGLDLAHVAWLQAWFSVVVIVAEVPTGILADRLGHRVMLVAGSVVFSMSLVVLATGDTLPAFVVSEALGAVGLAGMSGADKSLLYAAISGPRRDAIFARTDSRARGTAVASQALGSVVGGALGAISLRVPVLASVVTSVLAAAAAIGFPGPSPTAPPRGPKRTRRQLRRAWGVLRDGGQLRRASLTFVVLGAVQWAGFWLLQPLLIEHGVAPVHFGTVLAALLAVVFVASHGIDGVMRRVPRRVLGLAAVGTACALGLVAAGGSLWTLPLFAAISWFEVLMTTAVTMTTLAVVPREQTATVLSLMTAARRTAYALLMLGVGELATRGSVSVAAAALAAVSMLICVIAVHQRRRARSGPEADSPSAAPIPKRSEPTPPTSPATRPRALRSARAAREGWPGRTAPIELVDRRSRGPEAAIVDDVARGHARLEPGRCWAHDSKRLGRRNRRPEPAARAVKRPKSFREEPRRDRSSRRVRGAAITSTVMLRPVRTTAAPGSAAALLALALASPAPGCRVVDHPTEPYQPPPAAAAPADWDAVLAAPVDVEAQIVVAAHWEVSRRGLVNLRHPVAKEAGLRNETVPIVLQVGVIRHPDAGDFIVDTGIDTALAQRDSSGAIRGLPFAITKKMQPLESLAAIVERLELQVNGVLLTHSHFDHVMGLPDLPPETPVYTGAGELSERRKFNGVLRSTNRRLFEGRDPVREIDPATTIALDPFPAVVDLLGDGSIWGIVAQGHTHGSMAWLVNASDGPVLFVGDTSHTRWGWEHGVEPGTFTGDHERNAEALAQLRTFVERYPQTRVYLGHQL